MNIGIDIAAVLLATAALVTAAPPARAAWDHPHGDSANSGLAKVVTERAVGPCGLCRWASLRRVRGQ